MDILAVYPKGWHVRIELTLEQVLKILDFLDKCEFHGDLKSEKDIAAKEYVTKEFFPKLDKLAEDIQKS